MKQFLSFILFFPICMSSFAQTTGSVHFSESSWNQMLAQAKSENKLIFVDAFAVWCGPCKWMDKNVLTDSGVSNLYNRNFINLKSDMEKGEGIALKEKYNVRAYPTYLFINGDGEVVHKGVGQSTLSEFTQLGLDALSPVRNMTYYQKNYDANKNDLDFVSGYLNALGVAYELNSADSIALEYLSNLNPALLKEKSNWQLFKKYISDASSKVFVYIVNHENEFESLYDKKEVEQKLYNTYLGWPKQYVQYSKEGKPALNKEGFNSFISQLEKGNYEKKNEIIAKSKLDIFFGLRDWNSYSSTVSQMISNGIIPLNSNGADELYKYIDLIYRFGKENASALSKATDFAKTISEKISGITDQKKASYQDMYANLLEETGKKEQAVLIRKSIDQNELTQSQKSSPFQQMKIIPQKNK